MQAEAFVNFPAFELMSQSIHLWLCIIEHCDARTVSLLGVSKQLVGMVSSELRARFTLASRPILAPTVTIKALWLLIELKGGGIVGRHALSVWNSTTPLPLDSLELSLPLGELLSTEAWFIRRGYFSTAMDISSDRANVVKTSSYLVNGTVSLIQNQ